MTTWHLLKEVGAGGFGRVFLADDPEGHRVAVKLCPATARLEVETLLSLRHPSLIVPLGFLANSSPIFGDDRGACLWMEWIEGRPLSEVSKDAAPDAVFAWFRQALDVLAYLESSKIVHGDLSPSNFLIDDQGRLKLIDFGADDAATLLYTAPERMDGVRSHAGDLFALGTVFYEALAGRHPRGKAASLREFWRRPVRPLEMTADKTACRLIERLIAVDPAERLTSAATALKILEGGTALAAAPSLLSYHHPVLLGSEAASEKLLKAVRSASSGVFCVHGATGTGKSRFLNEILFQSRWDGVSVEDCDAAQFSRGMSALPQTDDRTRIIALRGLDALPVSVLSRLLSVRNHPLPVKTILVLEWNDDGMAPEARVFFDELKCWAAGGDILLRPLDPTQTREFLSGALRREVAKKEADNSHRLTGGRPRLILLAVSSVSSADSLWDAALSGLTPEETAVLRLLCVARGEADAEAWRAATGFSARVFHDALEALKQRSLVRSDGSGARFRPAAVDLSSYVLKRLAASQSLELHRRWYEVLKDGATASPDALHHAAALGDAAAVTRSLRTAVESLAASNRNGEALALLEKGMELVDDPAERSRLLRGRINLLNEIGRYEDALGTCEEWFRWNGPDEPTQVRAAKYWLVTGINHQNLGNHDEARDRFLQCLSVAVGFPDAPRFALRANTLMGLQSLRAERPAEAEEFFDQALIFAPPNGRRRAEVLRNQAAARAALGDPAAARPLLDEARRLCEEEGFPDGVFAAVLQKGIIASQAGSEKEAIAAYGEAETLAEGFENPVPLASVWHNRAVLLCRQKRYEESLELFEKSHRVFRALNLKQDLAQSEAEWAKAREGAATAKPVSAPAASSESGHEVIARILDLSHSLLKETQMSRVLKRLMDAALEVTGTENGFLLLENKAAQAAPLPGFDVAVARNIAKEDLVSLDYAVSLSAVREALKTGEPVVTDNAAADPRFREAKSVLLSGLKSILALPVSGPKGLQGVFYLDHRFREGLFGDASLPVLKVFAAVASLALQKGRMIEELRQANAGLEQKVEDQVRDAQTMKRELEESRRLLKHRYGGIIGRSPRMLDVLALVDRITEAKVAVWIFGESGTGKEAIARALHFNSARALKPFVSENCSALPESLLESELFGHKKGSFTHASADKKGILEYADGGTIFLDEIADMSLAMQAKLLRFLQEGEIRPIGSNHVVKVDVRVVSASNKDLGALVAQGKFREDLFYRLNGVTVTLPPLKERREDIPLLVAHFLKDKALALAPEAMEIFLTYDWPGNVRELQNTLETAALFAEDGRITPKSLKFKAVLSGKEKRPGPVVPLQKTENANPKLLETLAAIRDQCFHRGRAAEALGISRRNLYTRLARYGIASDLETIKTAIGKYLGP